MDKGILSVGVVRFIVELLPPLYKVCKSYQEGKDWTDIEQKRERLEKDLDLHCGNAEINKTLGYGMARELAGIGY
jgi:hypothetical protein